MAGETGEGESASVFKVGDKFGRDADALIQLSKAAKRAGVSQEDAETLLQWAKEYKVSPALDHIGTTHWVGGDHIRIGPVNHIPVQ